MVDVVDRDRAALGGDAAGEALAEGDLDALLDLFLDPLGGARPQHAVRLVEHQDRRGVAVEDLGDPAQKLRQKVVF